MRKTAVLLLMLLASCSPKVYPPTSVTDSVRVEIREHIVHDSVFVEIPKIKEVNVTRDSSSHLENDYASSDASIVDGLLHHSLESRPQRIYVPYTVEVHDTTIVREHGEVVIKEVNKLTWAQKVKLKVFWLLALATVMYAVTIFLIFRKRL